MMLFQFVSRIMLFFQNKKKNIGGLNLSLELVGMVCLVLHPTHKLWDVIAVKGGNVRPPSPIFLG